MVKKILQHIGSLRRKQLLALTSLMIVSSFAEAVSIGAVLPFLAVLTDPEKVMATDFFRSWALTWGVDTKDKLILAVTVIFISAVIFSSALRVLLLWGQIRINNLIGADLSVKAYELTLYQPLSVHLKRSSSIIISGIGKVDGISSAFIAPMMTLVSSILMVSVVFLALVSINPSVAFSILFGFGLIYFLISILFKKKLDQNSRAISSLSVHRIKLLQEAIGGIRDVLLNKMQGEYSKLFKRADGPMRAAQASTTFISSSPKLILEALGIILITVIAYFVIVDDPNDALGVVPTLGAFALAAQRVMPVLQQSYAAVTGIRGGRRSVLDALELLDQKVPQELHTDRKLVFKKQFDIEGLWFRYRADSQWVLKNISISIPKGSKVGIIGSSGGGKSTLFDIMMGLLSPTKGRIIIDKIPLDQRNLSGWWSLIAHVPQSVFLADASIAENIAFGVPPEKIDYERVKSSAQIAQISSDIEKWSEGYSMVVGERGVKLSGGQKQRIGIARAIYTRAQVIFFDEATSALDNNTENMIVESINGMATDLTIFMIAHRLTTLKFCDLIIKLDGNSIDCMGSYADVIGTNIQNKSI